MCEPHNLTDRQTDRQTAKSVLLCCPSFDRAIDRGVLRLRFSAGTARLFLR